MIELAVICGLLVALNAWQMADRRRERQEVVAERRDLLLRIQAPQTAVAMDYNAATAENPPAVDMTDTPMGDESYWLSREELAEKMAAEELQR